MGYEKLIRYGLWALFIASCILFVWWVSSSIHESIYNDGRLAERAEWEAKDAKRSDELAKAIADATKAMVAERESQTTALTEALENEIRAKERLNNDLVTLRNTNHGLWIDAKNCADRSAGATEETQGTGIGGGGAERIRLPEKVEYDLWELAADAQRVVIQYETLRQTCLPLVEVVPDMDG